MNRMRFSRAAGALALASALSVGSVAAQDLLIRNATVHTATARGTLHANDVRVKNGRIAEIGAGLAPGSATVIDAGGKPLTPALFGGIAPMGLDELPSDRETVDNALSLGENAKALVFRPEFDVTLAYNPESILLPVARAEGVGWALLNADSTGGGSIVAGQGAPMRLDGGTEPAGPRVLFVSLGAGASKLSGQSRAAQWMLLDQLADEAAGRLSVDSPHALLTPAGRRTLARYFGGGGRLFVRVQRASDIRQLLRWSAARRLRLALIGADEAWKVAAELAAAKVPVFVDPLSNLPGDFDRLGATLENAARLHAAGVAVSFAQDGDAAHNARKLRQLAGNAVANGLPWEAGFAGLTRIPAEAIGVASDIGSIAVGQRADLVLWTGDPLEVSSVASQVWFDGRAIPMRSRQTELRDRYLKASSPAESGGLPRAYSQP